MNRNFRVAPMAIYQIHEQQFYVKREHQKRDRKYIPGATSPFNFMWQDRPCRYLRGYHYNNQYFFVVSWWNTPGYTEIDQYIAFHYFYNDTMQFLLSLLPPWEYFVDLARNQIAHNQEAHRELYRFQHQIPPFPNRYF